MRFIFTRCRLTSLSEGDEEGTAVDDDERLFAARFMHSTSTFKRRRATTDDTEADIGASGEE